MTRLTLRTLVAGMLIGGTALALDAGKTSVYIRARDTHAYSQPGAKGKVTVLQPGATAYTWEGHQGTWNQLKTASGKRLWVYGPNLSLTPPQQELTASADGQAHAADLSAADAIKGLGDGAQWYAGKVSPEKGKVAVQKVATAEKISIDLQPRVLEKLKGGAQ